MKAAIKQNMTCAIETAAFTGLYSLVLFAGAKLITALF